MILIIDDDPVLCDLLVDRAKKHKIELDIEWVESCDKAVKVAQQFKRDDVIVEKLFVDMRLPGKNGIDTIIELQSKKLIDSNTKVYVMTAFPEMISMVDIRNLKVSAIILKQLDYIGVILSIIKFS